MSAVTSKLRDDGILVVTMAQPPVNALSVQGWFDVAEALNAVAANPAVKVVILRAEGKGFNAGVDIKEMQNTIGFDALIGANKGCFAAFKAVYECAVPVIAAVNGFCVGGGVGLVACCDVAIGANDATFALSEAKLGLIPATIGPYVVSAIGARQARRYFLTGERFDAAEAYRIGLLHEMVTDDAALDEAVGEVIDALLGNGPAALAECKQLIGAVAWKPLSLAVIEDTAQRITRVRASEEGREGMTAFLEKRKPGWIQGA